MTARPQWRLDAPDPRPGSYYTSVIDGKRWRALSGPYASHRAALAALPADTQRAMDYGDPRAMFAAYGTMHWEDATPLRTLFPVAD